MNIKELGKERDFLKKIVMYLKEVKDILESKATKKKIENNKASDLIDGYSQDIENNMNSLSQEMAEKKKFVVSNQISKPYFSKISFKEDLNIETLYIGLNSIEDQHNNIIVVDWRAPICSLYYEKNIGNTFYESNGQKYCVDLILKRNFEIKNGILFSYYDVAEDTLLLEKTLNKKSSLYLSDITSTIQKDQYEIISEKKNKNILVAGCAGSGKTSVLLQRVGYIMYNKGFDIKNKNILIFSGSKKFSHYIKNVLPDLGEADVRRADFSEIFGFDKNKTNIYTEQLNLNYLNNFLRKMNHIKFKLNDFIPIYLGSYILFSQKELYKLYTSYQNESSKNSCSLIIDYIENNIENKIKKFFLSKDSDSLIQNISIEKYKELTHTQEFKNYSEEKLFLLNILMEKEVRDLIDNPFQFLDMNKILSKIDDSLCGSIAELFQKIVYIELFKCNDINISHVFIDEVQNYSLPELYLISRYYATSSLFCVGDPNQSNHDNETIYENDDLISWDKYYHLNVSYRSTYEITQFSKGILENCLENNFSTNIKPYERHGEVPHIYLNHKDHNLYDQLKTQIINSEDILVLIYYTLEDYLSIKELLKTLCIDYNDFNSGKHIYKAFNIISYDEIEGLEFDNVIIFNPSTIIDRPKEIYVSVTRAKHNLYLYLDNLFFDAVLSGIDTFLYRLELFGPRSIS